MELSLHAWWAQGHKFTTIDKWVFEKHLTALLYEGNSSWVNLSSGNSLLIHRVRVVQLKISVWGRELQKNRSGGGRKRHDLFSNLEVEYIDTFTWLVNLGWRIGATYWMGSLQGSPYREHRNRVESSRVSYREPPGKNCSGKYSWKGLTYKWVSWKVAKMLEKHLNTVSQTESNFWLTQTPE